jgi:hypothetical protein
MLLEPVLTPYCTGIPVDDASLALFTRVACAYNTEEVAIVRHHRMVAVDACVRQGSWMTQDGRQSVQSPLWSGATGDTYGSGRACLLG